MHHALRLATALLAALAVPVAAQDTAPPAERPAAKPDQPQAERPAAAQDGAQAQRPAQQRAENAKPAADAPSRDSLIKKTALEEGKHRNRLAKIERLRTLAEQKGQTDRLQQLGDLLKRENDRYAGYREKARGAMGDNTFKALESRLAQGRGRGADPAAQRAKQQQRQAAGDKPAQGQQRAKQPDAKPDKPAGERPKGNAGGGKDRKAAAGGAAPAGNPR